jgi:hypothetical protein
MLKDTEKAELARLEELKGRQPEDVRIARSRLRFKSQLPPELWQRMLAAKRAQVAAIKERESIERDLRTIAPDDDEADLLWWVGEQVSATVSEAVKTGSAESKVSP